MALGRKQLEQLAAFTSSAVAYGLTGVITMFYLTDWKPVVTYIPFYNTQFKKEKKREPDCE